MEQKTAIIIGAGPAGLAAAYELLTRTDIKPIIFESTGEVGGLSKNVTYNGNHIDVGGHMFYPKYDRVVKWWENFLPRQGKILPNEAVLEGRLPLSTDPNAPDPLREDKVFLVRPHLSRIFYMQKLFDYPISFSFKTFKNLGLVKTFKMGFTYLMARLFPIKNEKSLEDFFINRFGKELYLTFFKEYTKKATGADPKDVKPEWGKQRIQGLSITKALINAIKETLRKNYSKTNIEEICMVKWFLYPKLGPGQMWDEVAKKIREKGGVIHTGMTALGMKIKGGRIESATIKNEATGEIKDHRADYFFSCMPVRDLVRGFGAGAPPEVKAVAEGLKYRAHIMVNLNLKKINLPNDTEIKSDNGIIPDVLVYIHEKGVNVGRLQIFNNWSPFVVRDRNVIVTGLEYFCNEHDEFWKKSDAEILELAIDELTRIRIMDRENFIDGTVLRTRKAYPAYYGAFENFGKIRSFVDGIENLYLIGRNGLHKYNNMDHAVLTSLEAVGNIVNGRRDRDNVWSVNTEKEELEVKPEE